MHFPIFRIFISTLVVIQNNPNVQTQGDRLIKVGCIMSNATLRESRTDGEAVDLNLHVDDDGENVDGDGNNMPNAIALESTLEFAQR